MSTYSLPVRWLQSLEWRRGFFAWARTDGVTWVYIFKVLAAAFITLWLAMRLELPQPRTAMITVFIDCTERSPTFRLFPLDKRDAAERRCWVQVWTEGEEPASAWRNFLGRRFRGLSPAHYLQPLQQVEDPYLRRAALPTLSDLAARLPESVRGLRLGHPPPVVGDDR